MKICRRFDLLYLALLVAYILAGTASAPFHGDESTLIYMSRDFAYQFLQGDIDRVRFHDPPLSATEQELRLLNGTVSKYLYGLAWHLGGFTVDDLNEQWDWGADWNYNQSSGHAPSEALLQISRIPSAVLLAAGVVVMFALGNALGGRSVAYLASLYYALNPALLLNGRRAMMEGSTMFFTLLAVLAAVWLLQRRQLWVGVLLGMAAGLALASKHSAVFTVAAVFGACALYPLLGWIEGKWGVFLHLPYGYPTATLRREENVQKISIRLYALLILAGMIAALVFYALNPAWWGDPLARLGYVLEMRGDLLTGQTAAFGGYANLPDALGGFFRQVFVNVPQYYEVADWATYIADQIGQYERSIWRGVSIGGSVAGGLVLLALTLVGFWALARDKATSGAVRWVIGVWALAMFASTALLTPLEWQRYYIPAYPAVGLLASYGIVWLVRQFRSYRLAMALES